MDSMRAAEWSGLYGKAVAAFEAGGLAGGGWGPDPWIDFEWKETPDSVDEVAEWLGFWTGGTAAPAELLSPIGADGSGGTVCVFGPMPDDFETSPVVFLGSEGEVAVIAADLADFLILLSRGYEPQDFTVRFDGSDEPQQAAGLTELLRELVPERMQVSSGRLVERARATLPDFETTVRTWVAYGTGA